jgi:hypothetical protein
MFTHSDTMAVFSITEMSDLTSTDLNLFFPVGLPAGHELVRAGLTLEPRLTQITPNEGSPFRTLITATVHGVGVDTTGLDLILPDGTSMCKEDTLKVVAYSKVQCMTRMDTFGVEPLAISVKHGENTYACANESDATMCNYKQNNEGEVKYPVIDSVEITGTTMVFTGEFFYTLGYSAQASFKDIPATTVTIDSNT